MRHLILLLAFVAGVFALLQTYVKSYAENENLEEKEIMFEKQLDSTKEIFFYELGMLESYSMNSNMKTIESYFYETESGERIYEEYDFLEKFKVSPLSLERDEIKPLNEVQGKKSIGGYEVSYMNPTLRELPEGKWGYVTFKVSKFLEVMEVDRSIFKVRIETGYARAACMIQRAERKLICSPGLGKVEELTATGM